MTWQSDIPVGAMMMSKTKMPKLRIAATCQIMLALAGDTAAHAQAQGPCQQIGAACREAGFVQGGARTGEGIVVAGRSTVGFVGVNCWGRIDSLPSVCLLHLLAAEV
jgi:hypothetical protein